MSPPRKHWLLDSESLVLFFPEGIVAALFFLTSPGWLVALLFNGHLLAGAILAIGVTAAGALAGFAFAWRSRGLLYASMATSIVVAWWVSSLSHFA
jgi:hypothetical protein